MDDLLFYKRATDAIVSTTLSITTVEPTIRELLRRIKEQPIHKGGASLISTTVNAAELHGQPVNVPPSVIHKNIQKQSSTVSVNKPSQVQGTQVNKDSRGTNNKVKKPSMKKKVKVKEEPLGDGFHCGQCSLKFARSSDLRRHERAHLLVLPYICTQCGKGFARKDALKRHSNTMTCERNRRKLMQAAGREVSELIKEAVANGRSL